MDGVEIFLPSVFNIFNKQCLFSFVVIDRSFKSIGLSLSAQGAKIFPVRVCIIRNFER